MDNLFKKKLIACLLAIACVVSALTLLTDTEEAVSFNAADADSLLLRELNIFNIPTEKIRWERIDIDSTFYRKNYKIKLPIGISPTWFHSELSRKLYDYNLDTWANVEFPENTIDIHIMGENTILRSINLEIDTSYHRRINPATIMVYFDRQPKEELIDRIEALGEPIPMVLRVQSPAQAESWAENLGTTRHRYYFWMNDVNNNPDEAFNRDYFVQRSQRLAEVSSRPALLFFEPVSSKPDSDFFRKLADQNISLIETREATIITPAEGKAHFDREFDKFTRLAKNGQHPVALVRASEQSLEWFSNNLIELKKGGIVLTLPRLMTE
ncbi:MAG: hypothetical protein WD267_01565 [Balneolales bacterium]